MDFNLKQRREQQQHESDQDHEKTTPCAKLPRLHLDSFDPQHRQHQQPPSAEAAASSALPLFVTEPTSNMSAACPPLNPTKYPSCCFSLAQWQELELQALIFRHMLAGAAVPPELLHHLVKKSLLNSSPHHSFYLPVHRYPPHFQPALLQPGYWGRSSMDPEPGRCRRTDGKKWRCSRDVVAGQKYCERHMHRGRNRSRKPVEIPTTHAATITIPHGNGAQRLGAMAAGGKPHFTFSGSAPSIDLLRHSQRQSEAIVNSQNDVHEDDKSSGQILRHFFNDWPRSLQESENEGSNARSMTSATNLSMAIAGAGNPASDFSLKLSTGDGDNTGATDPGWGANQVASMGGPLAEALRSSSTSNSSPTSVLHQLQRGSASASEISYVST